VFQTLYRKRRLVMEDQLLRAKETGDTRLSNPHAYDLRKRYHKVYYHFKPDYWFWILVILGRKFLIAVTSLLFVRNPAFQLSVALLVMFVSYALQVRFSPYMSMSEHNDVLRGHVRKAEEDPMSVHAALAQTIAGVMARGRKRTAQRTSWANPRGAARATANFFFNYNTVESVLLFCAVLVNLAGVMFESGQLDSEHYESQRDFLTVATLLIIFFSIAYFLLVFFSELWETCKPKKMVDAKTAKKSASGGGMSPVMEPTSADPEASTGTQMNPMFLSGGSAAGGGDSRARALADIIAGTVPDPASWELVKNAYKELETETKQLKRSLQTVESNGRAARPTTSAGAAASALRPTSRAAKKTFGQVRAGAAKPRGRKGSSGSSRRLTGGGSPRRRSSSELADLTSADPSLPPGWVEAYDETYERQYWVNTNTRESSWTKPTA